MKHLARCYVYWKSIDKNIERMVRSCPECASIKSSPSKAPLHPWAVPEHNWQRIHIDFAGPFKIIISLSSLMQNENGLKLRLASLLQQQHFLSKCRMYLLVQGFLMLWYLTMQYLQAINFKNVTKK